MTAWSDAKHIKFALYLPQKSESHRTSDLST